MIAGRAVRVSHCWTSISKTLLLFLVCTVFSIPAGRTAGAAQVVIALGDVHGDFDDFCLIRKRVGLIDEKLHWAAATQYWCRQETFSIGVRRSARSWI
jgi:hypothetical protein